MSSGNRQTKNSKQRAEEENQAASRSPSQNSNDTNDSAAQLNLSSSLNQENTQSHSPNSTNLGNTSNGSPTTTVAQPTTTATSLTDFATEPDGDWDVTDHFMTRLEHIR